MATTETVDHNRWVKLLSEALLAGQYCNPPGPRQFDPFGPYVPQPHQLLPAGAIREVLSTQLTPTPSGLQLGHVVIVGHIDLTNIDFPFPIWLNQCRFDDNLDLTNSKIAQLSMTDVSAGQVILNGSEISGGVHCFRRFDAQILSAVCAKIGHRIFLSDTTLRGDSDGIALALDAAEIRGNVVLENFLAVGEVRMPATRISNQLSLSDAELKNEAGAALILDGAEIKGGINAGKGFNAVGMVTVMGANIGVAFELTHANITAVGDTAILADNAQIHGDFLCEGVKIKGGMRLPGLQVDGSIILDRANLKNPTGVSLELSGAKISQNIAARLDFRSEGTIHAVGANLGGRLVLQRAHLWGSNEALSIDRSVIQGGVYFTQGSTATGQITAAGVKIHGDLDLTNSTITSKAGHALVIDNAEIYGSLIADHQFMARGGIRGIGIKVSGTMNLRNSHLTNSSNPALDLSSGTIRQLVLANSIVDPGIDLSRASLSEFETIVDMPPPVSRNWANYLGHTRPPP